MKSQDPSLLRIVLLSAACVLLCVLPGCSKKEPAVNNQNDRSSDKLVLISPHHESIRYEFEKAFREYYLNQTGRDVVMQWRDVGGGSSSILTYLRNVYDNADTSGIDVLFGGGEYTFQVLDAKGLCEPLELSEDILANVPETFGGMRMYSEKKTWIGNVLSSFGFLYNKELLTQYKIQPPTQWEDLGKPDLYNLVVLADPTQSGSVAAAYEMIVQSAPNWQDGWSRLLMILSNAKKFTDSSGAAAEAPVLGEAMVSICIDFYGSMRVESAPDKLGYVSPKGETGFTPDPICILKNPPNPKPAKAFIDFLLSVPGQALWALEPGHEGGPERTLLNREPIRKDFYTLYGKDLPEWIPNPYAEGAEMIVDAKIREVRYGVLAKLVRAAAIENLSQMQAAKKKLIDSGYDAKLLEAFTKLPENVDTTEEIFEIAEKLKDPAQNEKIVTDWTIYFRNLYRNL